MPVLNGGGIKTPRAPFREALRAMSLAANDRTGGVKLSIIENALRITSESPESGNGLDEVTIDYAGPDAAAGFNAKYLIDVLDAMKGIDIITLDISGLDPAVVRPASEDGEEYIAVVMPMRI